MKDGFLFADQFKVGDVPGMSVTLEASKKSCIMNWKVA